MFDFEPKIQDAILVPVCTEDAALILELRMPAVAKGFLKQGATTVETQCQWLAGYLAASDISSDKYFMVSHRGKKIGTVRVRELGLDTEHFSWGSWCMKPGSHPRVVVASCLLAYEVGFSCAGKTSARFEVHHLNDSVLAFHKKMGAEEIGRTNDDQIQFSLKRTDFVLARERLMKALKIT